jgi:hypothetical protein
MKPFKDMEVMRPSPGSMPPTKKPTATVLPLSSPASEVTIC